jgi:hypothetical protein
MIKGTYIFKENGIEIARSSNVITKFGKRFLTNFIAGNVDFNSKDLAIGIDSTAATVNDTRLGFEFYRLPVEFGSTDIQTIGGTTTYSVVYKTTIPVDVSGTISEIGLYPSTRLSTNNYDSKFLADFNSYLDWYDPSGNHPDPVENTSLITYAKIGSDVIRMTSNGTSAKEYTLPISGLDISGYSVNDSIRLAYYKEDANLEKITIKFYSSNTDYYYYDLAAASGTGYKLSADILLSSLVASGSPDKSAINKIGIVIDPLSSATSVGLDGLRINDEDTFDPIFGIISRSILPSPLTKLAGRQVDIEYRLDLGF